MTKKKAIQTPKANGLKALPKTERFVIEELVTVGQESHEVTVEMSVNCRKNGTFKITASLTTKNVHPTDPESRDAVSEKLRQMTRAMMDKGIEMRRYWTEENGGDPDQLELEFSSNGKKEEYEETEA